MTNAKNAIQRIHRNIFVSKSVVRFPLIGTFTQQALAGPNLHLFLLLSRQV